MSVWLVVYICSCVIDCQNVKGLPHLLIGSSSPQIPQDPEMEEGIGIGSNR